ncbi:hypothetical protein D0Z07_8687 [Hyphodiscus hymeniophilus]|uniref:Uncharacterized protein n=1 Tax=Hyphodiscus hymeniophilus TaxID=353542 RepID=A0A9P6VCD0_9HELO|nr:hypothetical protein D0Z07_8687 [Hyphodiscus hymeniophilus]
MANDGGHAVAEGGDVEQPVSSTLDLAFVNVGTMSLAERQRNQRLIRSTAMKSFRRRQLSERSTKKENDSKDGTNVKNRQAKSSKSPKANPLPGSPGLSIESSSEVSRPLDISSMSGRRADYVAIANGRGSESLSSRAMSVDPNPIPPLGAGRVDPFCKLAYEPGSHINELIDHGLPQAVTRMWPVLRPHHSDNATSSISAAWLEKIYERPVVMHALLFGASVHLDVLRYPSSPIFNPIRLHHKVQTMRLLKEELKSPEKTPLDEVILAVLCLAANEVETFAEGCSRGRSKTMRSPFMSPLRSAQWLDVYGSIAHIEAHTKAMRSLVERRGGLEMIALEGLAEVLSFSDILGATQGLSKPYWPLLDRTKDSRLEPFSSGRRLGRGFHDFMAFGLTERAATVLQEMVDLTVIIDNHCGGIRFIPNTAVLVDHRNTVQYNLMSLPKGDELADGEVRSTTLYDAIRLAAILYSAAVTFPLPPLTGIFPKFSSVLRTAIEDSELDPTRQCSNVFLWILVLGGIAATGAADRACFDVLGVGDCGGGDGELALAG